MASSMKMVGMAEKGAQISQDGVAVHHIFHASACVIFILLPKIQKMANKDMTFGYHPWVPPHAYTNRRQGNSAEMQHSPVLGCRATLMMT